MSVFDTTAATVKIWATRMTDFPSPNDRLEVLWATYGQGRFYKTACRDLMNRIYEAFPGASTLKKDVQFKQIKDTNANAAGDIDTVDDLADAIADSLSSHEMVFLPPAARQPGGKV
jgi:hypothetical protein